MSIPLDTLEAEVLKLSAGARSHLLDRLIASLETDSEIEEAWALEAERRDAEVEEGKVETRLAEGLSGRKRGRDGPGHFFTNGIALKGIGSEEGRTEV